MLQLKRLFASRKLWAGLWLLALVPLLGLHFGLGQTAQASDRVATHISAAHDAQGDGQWADAVKHWRDAQLDSNGDADETLRLALSAEMARVRSGELPEATEATAALLDEAVEKGASDETQRDIRAKLGAMHYWMAWLMRLEGASAEEWEPVSEQARQHFRILAETDDADTHAKNLESVIRLQRMDLSELQGLPIPKECRGNKNCSSRCKSQREGRCNNPGNSPKDGREKVQEQKKKGAGVYNGSGTGY